MLYSLGGKVKELRIKRGLSQDELAEKVNDAYKTSINKGMISKWENNVVDPSLETARILALFFGITLDELLGIQLEDTHTVAAHHDGEEWTDEELQEIERFKEFVKLKRKQQE